jgi:FMN phosphatase YigB (HAD superfamily)
MENKKPEIKVLAVDLEECLLVLPKGETPQINRVGASQFLDNYSNLVRVLYTDAGKSEKGLLRKANSYKNVEEALEKAGLYDKFDEIHTGSHMDGEYKDLGKIAEKYNIPVESIVIVGDSEREVMSAKHYGAHYVKVPNIAFEAYPEGSDMALDEIMSERYDRLAKLGKVFNMADIDIYRDMDSVIYSPSDLEEVSELEEL